MSDKNAATGIDEDVKIPAAVRASTEAANRLIEEQRKLRDGEPLEGEGEADGEVEGGAPAEDPSQQQPNGTYKPKPNDAQDPNDDSWRQKFLSEQGRSQGFQRQISNLTADIDDLRRRLSEKQAEPVKPKSLLTEQEIEDYGPDMIDVIGRRAKEIADEMTAPLRNQIAELSRKVNTTETVVHMTKAERFERDLEKRVPNWGEINVDENWINWLSEIDPISGQERQVMLNRASEALDAARVAAFFEAYAREAGVAIASQTPAPAQAQQPVKAKLNLESLVAPGTSRQAPTAPVDPKDVWIKASDIKAFYDDVARGKYRGRESEQAEMEREIQEANRKNQIRPD